MIITGAMPAQHFSGVSHHRRSSRYADHDFAAAVPVALWSPAGAVLSLYEKSLERGG